MPLLLADVGGLELFLLTLFNALTEGSTYALIAVGYTMVYGIIKLINFAHGEVYMIGAVVAWWLFVNPQVPLILAIPLSMLACAALGFLLDLVAYRPLRKSTRLAALITAIGMSLILQTLVQLILDPNYHAFPETTRAVVVSDEKAPAYREPGGGGEVADRLRSGAKPPVVDRRDDWVAVSWRTRQGTETLWVASEHVAIKQGTPELLNTNLFESVVDSQVEVKTKTGAYAAAGGAGAPAVELEAGETRYLVLDASQRDWIQIAGAGSGPLWVARQDVRLHLPELKLPFKDVLIWVVAAAMMGGLHLLVMKTKLGRAMRACALDQTTSALMGVDVNKVIAMTFVIGSAMAAVAGVLYSLKVGGNIYFRMGYYPGVIAFAAAVLGGIGDLKGALLGGMLLGFAKAFCATYLSSSYDFAFCFSVMILVIIFRPYGLLGKPGATRA